MEGNKGELKVTDNLHNGVTIVRGFITIQLLHKIYLGQCLFDTTNNKIILTNYDILVDSIKI